MYPWIIAGLKDLYLTSHIHGFVGVCDIQQYTRYTISTSSYTLKAFIAVQSNNIRKSFHHMRKTSFEYFQSLLPNSYILNY